MERSLPIGEVIVQFLNLEINLAFILQLKFSDTYSVITSGSGCQLRERAFECECKLPEMTSGCGAELPKNFADHQKYISKLFMDM